MRQWLRDVWDGLYTALVGMNITWRHLFNTNVTLQYPEEKWTLPPKSRMRVFMKYEIEYNNIGQTRITGQYRERPELLTELTFEIDGDQTYLQHSVSELKSIADKYGDNDGVKK